MLEWRKENAGWSAYLNGQVWCDYVLVDSECEISEAYLYGICQDKFLGLAPTLEDAKVLGEASLNKWLDTYGLQVRP